MKCAIQRLDRLSGVPLLFQHEAKRVPGLCVIGFQRQILRRKASAAASKVAFLVQHGAEVEPGIRQNRAEAEHAISNWPMEPSTSFATAIPRPC